MNLIPFVNCSASWLPGYSSRELFYWQSDLAAQDSLTVVNSTNFDSDNTFYIYNETLSSFEDLAVTLNDGVTRLSAWNITTYYGVNCTFWVNFPVANTTYFLYWSNPDASSQWDKENTFEYVGDALLALPLDEGTGSTAHDYSVYKNNGTLNGICWVNGPFGQKSPYFSGSGAYGVIGNITAYDHYDNLTFFFFFNSSDLGATNEYVFYRYLWWWFYNPVGTNRIRGQSTYEADASKYNAVAETFDITENANYGYSMMFETSGSNFNISLVSTDGTLSSNLVSDFTAFPNVNLGNDIILGDYFNGTISGVYIFNETLPYSQRATLNTCYFDNYLSSGEVVCRVWASSSTVTEFGTVETLPVEDEYTGNEILIVAIALIVIFTTIPIGLIYSRKQD